MTIRDVYVYEDEIAVAGKPVAHGSMAVLDNQESSDRVSISSKQPARALLVAGSVKRQLPYRIKRSTIP